MTHDTPQRGFSLVELLVAAMIFTFVVLGVTQLFGEALDLQRRATGYQKIQENALFVLESIAREVRVSAITSTNTDCSVSGFSGANELIIEHPDWGTIMYRYLESPEGRGYITREESGTGQQAEEISSGDVDITRFAFCISGAGVDDQQARITMPMTIQSISGRAATEVHVSLQATVASRNLIEELTN